jgi:hypothetical protein
MCISYNAPTVRLTVATGPLPYLFRLPTDSGRQFCTKLPFFMNRVVLYLHTCIPITVSPSNFFDRENPDRVQRLRFAYDPIVPPVC